jgi:hypothetical protein
MSTLNGQWIELFRAGDYGEKGSYGLSDIDKMIANYDPAKHEAPAVIGHPEHNAPAYGWVESLKRVGNVLMGKLKQVQPAFEEMVRQGLFKKRSISFYTTPNGPSLRHVGFLGAMLPEVKGLQDVKLADFTLNPGQFRTIDYLEESMDSDQISRSITQSLKEFFTEMFKGKKIESLNEGDQAKAIETAVAAAMKPLQDGYTKLQKEFDDQKKELETAKASASTGSQAAFAEKQIARVKDKKRWLPAFDKMGLPQLFTELAKSETKISFGEGDKKTEKQAAESLADFIIGLGEIVPMGEIANRSAERRSNLVQFNEPNAKSGAVIDEQSVAMAEAAKKLSEEKKIPYGDALKQVRASGEFEQAGAATAGQV